MFPSVDKQLDTSHPKRAKAPIPVTPNAKNKLEQKIQLKEKSHLQLI
jgi:hypothetical protein